MLPEGKHVQTVYLGSDGICSANIGGKLLIDCSTIDTATFLEVREHITKTSPSTSFYDAPVSGGVVGRKAPSLSSSAVLKTLQTSKVLPIYFL
jgi:3-hydroxyisobutyrate dehydrogenase-like beta-hydroxyacid dehydrogenase